MVQFAYIQDEAEIILRSRKPGDRYRPVHGMNTRVKDLMITAHIPQLLKDAVPVIEIDNKIVWLSGWRIAHDFRVPDNFTGDQGNCIMLKLGYFCPKRAKGYSPVL